MNILATTYAVNPNKGSEDGMGWNFVLQIARYNQVIAITRKNNQEAIDQYMLDNPSDLYKNITFLYYDLPYWLRFWKRGGKGAMLYYYLWQLFIPVFILSKRLTFDIVHNVNFHNDWTPSFLWVFGKPLVWGPIGHHPIINKEFIKDYSWKVKFKNKLNWFIKNIFWRLDPFLKLTKWQAKKVICMNSSTGNKLGGIDSKHIVLPSVASETYPFIPKKKADKFEVLSVGRLIPLKGFDLTIKSFHKFMNQLSLQDQSKAHLTIVGAGSHELFYKKLVTKLEIENQVTFIPWINRKELQAIYKRASVFLFPSHEGAGMVVSEALSHSLPVVTLDNCGPGEFIDETSGIKVKQTTYNETVTKLSESLTLLFTNERRLKLLSIGAYIQHKALFEWDRKGDVLAKVYQELLLSKTKIDSELITN